MAGDSESATVEHRKSFASSSIFRGRRREERRKAPQRIFDNIKSVTEDRILLTCLALP
jgi:hypothetical protein